MPFVDWIRVFYDSLLIRKVSYQFTFLLLLSSLIHISISLQFCHERYREGHRLNTTVYRNVFSMSEIDCILLCVVDKCCKATNYRKTTRAIPEKENCEILHEDHETEIGLGNFHENETYNYLKLHHPVRPFDCNCLPCKNDGICDDSTNRCSCVRGFIGERCDKLTKNCAELYKAGIQIGGIYTINPDDQGAFQVRCDMTTGAGGWTVFQRRMNGSQNFHLGWSDYKNGFGDLNGEFWLGLEKVYRLSQSGLDVLRVDLEDFVGGKAYSKYGIFQIASETEKYKLTIGRFSGTAGDSLARHNNMKFSTSDQDNDATSGHNCAAIYDGAWWFKNCYDSHLNGRYIQGPGTSADDGVEWRHWKNNYLSLKKSEMKIRPEDF